MSTASKPRAGFQGRRSRYNAKGSLDVAVGKLKLNDQKAAANQQFTQTISLSSDSPISGVAREPTAQIVVEKIAVPRSRVESWMQASARAFLPRERLLYQLLTILTCCQDPGAQRRQGRNRETGAGSSAIESDPARAGGSSGRPTKVLHCVEPQTSERGGVESACSDNSRTEICLNLGQGSWTNPEIVSRPPAGAFSWVSIQLS